MAFRRLARVGGQMTERRGARGWGWYHKALADQANPAVAVEFPTPEDGASRTRAYFDVTMEETNKTNRIVFELADDLVPTTVENFVKLCSGGTDFTYKGTKFNEIRKGMMVSGGDTSGGDGKHGGHSAMGSMHYSDDTHLIRHGEPGILSMINVGKDLYGSQFFITTSACSHLDGYHIPFGRVVEGMDVVKEIQSLYCVKGRPLANASITDCGVL